MKKRYRILLIISLVLILTCLFVGCNTPEPQPKQLSAPQDIKVNNDVLSWGKVDNAKEYVVMYDGNQYRVNGTTLVIHLPQESVDMAFKIKALPDDSGEYTESNWADFVYKYTYIPPQGDGGNQQQTTPKLKYTLINNGTAYEVAIDCTVNDSSLTGEVVIPSHYKNLPVTSVAKHAFSSSDDSQYNNVTTSIVLPDTINNLGSYAFKNCKALISVNLPEGITSISNQFNGCSALKSIVIPASVTILSQDFCDCTSLDEVQILSTNFSKLELVKDITTLPRFSFENTPWYNKQQDGFIVFNNILFWYKGDEEVKITSFPDTIEAIASGAFAGSKVTSLNIPDGLNFMRNNAFGAFSKMLYLKEINFPSDMTIIPQGLFYGAGIERLVLPQNIVEIEASAFRFCKGLKEIVFNAGLKKVGMYAFDGHSIQDLVVPSSVTSWGARSLQGEMKTITYAEGIESIYAAPFQLSVNNTCETITLSSTVKIIKKGAIESFHALKTINLASVEIIEEKAIISCVAIEKIVLPNTIKQMDKEAIKECPKLKEIVFADGTTKIPEDFINYCSGVKAIVLPTSINEIPVDFGFCLTVIPAEKLNISVYYKGTQEQWNTLKAPTYSNKFVNWTIHFYSLNQPSLNSDGTGYEGNYWCYDSDGTTIKEWKKP